MNFNAEKDSEIPVKKIIFSLNQLLFGKLHPPSAMPTLHTTQPNSQPIE